MNPCVIIPAHNEAKTIAGLISRIRALKLSVIVIDDGSLDDTAAVAGNVGADVLRNPRNLGKGAALVRGFDHCLKSGFDTAITMDGDGQHLPDDLPLFLDFAGKNDDVGLIIGNRMSNLGNMPFIRVVTNKFMSWILSLIVRQKIADSQCGFRLIRKGTLGKLSLKTHKFEIESEMIIEAARNGIKIASIPIHTVYMQERSHINPFVDTLRFFRFIFKKREAKK
jgi:glycosyltransferase involved in cell wall biosynthesis